MICCSTSLLVTHKRFDQEKREDATRQQVKQNCCFCLHVNYFDPHTGAISKDRYLETGDIQTVKSEKGERKRRGFGWSMHAPMRVRTGRWRQTIIGP
jgi:hypothetical protein